ncbi:fasciclin domain-containing protein [Micromonospora sp. DR5-3]|uniref:fasciclin domain-containing protein n=1 Tax=unclassified Micromonospora TaxID=2617518 RepID=UPI0011DBA9CF|nr:MULTISPECIES: fasciclin domain-containing protein [unclassified Micromonospora]MCW3818085.1 fasciclin domain-containing protein [Micromonospora sp. DR5-3]TYC22307.1 fasciclin domain-containing protein [Micromonospora sp. MP36]
MDQPVIRPRSRSLPRLRWPAARRRRAALAAAALSLVLAGTGCSGAGTGSPAAADGAAAPKAAPVVRGPLCDLLPSGSDPGNPTALTGQPPEAALQWLPVLTTFEAAVRASGMAADLHEGSGLTILAPTDDAFAAKFSEDNLDQLFLTDKDKLRGLLREHLVAGSLTLSDMVAAGGVTTLAGTKLTVSGGGETARLAGQADTVCADYQAANARIHIINRVLGNLPTTATEGGHRAH